MDRLSKQSNQLSARETISWLPRETTAGGEEGEVGPEEDYRLSLDGLARYYLVFLVNAIALCYVAAME